MGRLSQNVVKLIPDYTASQEKTSFIADIFLHTVYLPSNGSDELPNTIFPLDA
jgi:hypothetical protein